MNSDERGGPGRASGAPPWEVAARQEYWRVAAAFQFELHRSRTVARAFAWLILVLFPASIMAVFRYQNEPLPEQAWGVVLYLLATQATTLLALLLWVAPAIQVELEGRTWSYLSVRPGGKLAVLAGKYLSGVVWTASAGIVGLTIALLIIVDKLDGPLWLFSVLAALQLLGTFAYGALYLALGVLFPRRSMVVCVGFTLLFEVVVSLIPATINQLTVQHRLLNLLWGWMEDWNAGRQLEVLLGDQPISVHLAWLVGYTLVLLATAAIGVQQREYLTSAEV